MNLMLRAFGQSDKYTLKERALLCTDLHQQFSDLVGQYTWYLLHKQTVEIDIRNREENYPHILKEVKSGLNAKVSKPIRYKEDDIADITSSCNFYNKGAKGYSVRYCIGYPSPGGFPALVMGLDTVTDATLFTRDKLYEISLLFIKSWKPEMLCVTDRKYFHDISKAYEHGTPWTGWFTYVSKDLLQKQQGNTGLLQSLFKRPVNVVEKLHALKGFDIEAVDDLGYLLWTTKALFTSTDTEAVNKALQLERFFIDNKVRLSK